MATQNARAIAILEACLNTASTAAQRNELLLAFGDAQTMIYGVRNFLLESVRSARAAAAIANAAAATTADFPEAP